MCISRRRVPRQKRAFGLIELLVGLALALTLALAVAPLVLSLQSVGVEESDRSVQALQARVALSRLEKDTRSAGWPECPFATSGAVLEARSNRVVLLSADSQGSLALVEWEVKGSTLMRRRGACPVTRPGAFTASLFTDNKTMLEGVASGSRFVYRAGETVLADPLGPRQLALVDVVTLELRTSVAGAGACLQVATAARVGR